MPELSLIVPSLGKTAYINLLLLSLGKHTPQDFEVLLEVYPDLDGDLILCDFPIHLEILNEPGMGYASNRGLRRARGDWIAWINDDMVPLPGWADFEGRVTLERILCWGLLEPIIGSFSPPCYAGTEPNGFQEEIAVRDAETRREPPQAGNFFGTFVAHRSVLQGLFWSENTGSYTTADLDMPYRIFQKYPNVVFGRLGTWIYHFVHGSIRDHSELVTPGDDVQRLFVRQFGVTTGEAYDRLNARSLELWKT